MVFRYRPLFLAAAISLITFTSATADRFYFRMTSSVSRLNKEAFEVSINGDRTGVVGSSFVARATATGAKETPRFAVASGTLPPGVDINSESGEISGNPITRGTFDAVISVTDAFSTATAPVSIAIFDEIEMTGKAARYATVGEPYFSEFTAYGADGNFSWSLIGAPPPGVHFTGGAVSGGSLSGTPTAVGTYSGLMVKVAAESGQELTSDPFTISVAWPLSVDGEPAAFGTVGEAYAATFATSGGHSPYNWSVSGGSLPTGLSLSNGKISGIPTAANSSGGLTIRVVDVAGNIALSKPFSLNISGPLTVSGTPPLRATVGTPYVATFNASGGSGDYSWTMSNGLLPAGLSLADGKVSGIPTTAGESPNISIRVADGEGRTANSTTFTIAVADAISIAGSPSASGTVGESYSATFSVSGGHAPYDWSISGGPLPAGLTLSDGKIIGTPTITASAQNLVVKVTDVEGNEAISNPFSLTISDSLVIAGTPATVATVGTAYIASFAASGGSGDFTWALEAGTLPAGLNLADGKISGTPTTAGTQTGIIVKASDSNGRTAKTAAFSIVVSNPLVISAAPDITAQHSAYYSKTFTASGGDGSYVWTLASGTLPPGIAFSNGTISGTPTMSGTWPNISVRVADGNGRSAQTVAFSMTVSSPPVTAGTWTYQNGSGAFLVNEYNTLVVEVFGAGGGSGDSGVYGGAGGSSFASIPSFGAVTAIGGGGGPGDATGPAAGGGASGGDINLSGGNGSIRLQTPNPALVNVVGGASGGVSYGGGGATAPTPLDGRQNVTVNGYHGNGPGGGSGGCTVFTTLPNRQMVYIGTSSGGGGGYSRKVFSRGAAGAPTAGSYISFTVGNGGRGAANCPINGAGGMVRFTIN